MEVDIVDIVWKVEVRMGRGCTYSAWADAGDDSEGFGGHFDSCILFSFSDEKKK